MRLGVPQAALVRFDPEKAHAKVLARWEIDDGNTPDLRFAVPCGQGRLFVIAETKRSMLIQERGDVVDAEPLEIKGHEILGVACVDSDVEVFAKDASGYVIGRKDGEKLALVQHVSLKERSDEVLGAWRTDAGWRIVLGAILENGLRAGPLEGPYEEYKDANRDTCLAGEPGGWLFVNRNGPCFRTHSILGGTDSDMSVERLAVVARPTVLYAGRRPSTGYTEELQFGGLGELDFGLKGKGEQALGGALGSVGGYRQATLFESFNRGASPPVERGPCGDLGRDWKERGGARPFARAPRRARLRAAHSSHIPLPVKLQERVRPRMLRRYPPSHYGVARVSDCRGRQQEDREEVVAQALMGIRWSFRVLCLEPLAHR